ncbi:hypothetical protein BDW67DRAFT_172084 [Aspergillus spinulosporus]
MESAEPLEGLRGLYQDLSALSDSSLLNIDRLRVELETHIHDFRTLLDKPTKSNESRMSVLSGKITIDDVEYSVNDEFQQGTLQVADALDLDELLAALLPPVITAIINFHQRRHFLLESLRLIFQESFEVEREATQEMMQEMLAHVVEIKDGQLRNASLYTRKCLKSMEDIEKWLSLLGEQIQKASIVGQSEDQLVMEAIEHQRFTLLQQHESLGAILCYLFKGPYTSPEDLRILLKHLRKLDRFDGVLHGSPERSGNYQEARSLNTAVIATKDGQNWAHQPFHSAVIALWLSVYSAWDYDGPSSAPPGVDLEKEAEERTKTFMTALDDGGLDLLVSICSGVSGEEWSDPARSELVTMLLRESASWLKESGSATLEADSCSPYLKTLLMENFEVFAESCIANMPDAVRKLKTEEDSQRLDQITALRDGLTSNLHRDLVEARTHLESFLLIMAFAFEGRPDAAQEFWADPDGNLYGFLQWSSKRQTVPRVSAFCELLCSISGGEDNAAAAHRFLLEEDKFMSSKFKRSASMNWAQMFAELQIYATRITEKPSTAQTIQRTRKFEPADMSEPESPVMLSCYLRLIGHLSRQSAAVREWMLHHSSFNIVSTLLTLCSGPLPSHLRATVFQALAGLMTDRSVENGNEMWLAVDHWISSGAMSASAHNKVPLVSNPLIWHEQQAFEKIGESFDQANAFVVLILSLVAPAIDSAEYAIWVPFPESLGSSYRMPGIEPYIDFIMGQALSRKVPDLNERQSRLLTYNSLDFVLTCLRSFNETIVTALNETPATAEPNLKTSALLSYVRLHPFARVAEWLYNEDVIKTIFTTANQEIADIARASSDSVLVSSLVKSIEVMCSIIDLQSTYLNIVRPFIKSQPGSRVNVANSSLSAFEDCILNNLQIVPKLCLYCGTGHQELTVSSLALLAKLSSSTRLNKLSTPELSRWRSSNKIVEVLSAENLDSLSLPFISQMEPELRELDAGPQASGYLIRHNLLELLNSSLTMIPDRPTVAHLLLGFSSVGNVLDVSSDGLFAAGRSLLHAILGFVQTYPDLLDDNIVPWMLHLKRTAFEVLKHLWSSKLSSYFTLTEMRASGFLVSLFASQPLVGPHTLWDGLPIGTEQFWVCDSTDALAEFLLYRSYLFDYATTEIRSAAKMGSPTLLEAILATLFGSSTLDNGATIANPTVYDLFDFADLDVQFHARPPNVEYLGGLNIDICEKPVEDGSLVLYNVAQVKELVKARREELLSNGELRPQDDELFMAEADNLIEFLQARNQSRLINFNRHMALSSWAELLITILKCSELDSGRKSTFILHAIQLILPKLETAIEDDLPEALDLARLAESLVESLDATPAKLIPLRRNGDLIDEKLHQLFQICLRGIILSNGGVLLKETFYNICSIYVARIVSPDTGNKSMRQHSQQVAICDDAYTGQETCRVSAVLLLNSLAALDKQADATLAESIAQSNYLSLFLDSIRVLPLELRNAPANDTPLLLSYYQSLLSLLQQLCQTKPGATHVLKAGLFQAVRESHLFAADPDLGIDIDNADALRKYYDLLDSVLRVIVTATFSRGLQNELMIEQTRAFLTENRQSMVGIFKRFAKIGGSGTPDHHDALTSIAKSYTALIAATNFLEMQQNSRTPPEQRSGKRKATGKRKFPDQVELSQQPRHQQATISELLHRNQAQEQDDEHLPPTNKRVRPSPSSLAADQSESGNMYNFSTSGPKPNGPNAGGLILSNSTLQARPGNSSHQSNFTPHTGARRLVVKNLRTGPRLDQDSYFDKVWGQLDAALSAIFSGGKPEISIEELYKGAENVCRQGRATILSKRLQERCRQHVTGRLHDSLVDKAQMASNIDTLRSVVEAWKVWQSMLITVRWIFYYLDQSFLLHSKEHPVIREMGLQQFRQHIYSDPTLQKKVLQGACDLVSADRNDENSTVADSSLLRNAIELFHGLDVYVSGFEPVLISESKDFFSLWAQQEATGYLASYVENSHRLIEREMNRCEEFSFNRTTKQQLSESLDQTLVTDQESVLLSQKDILGLLRIGNKVALGQLYTLLERRDLGVKLKGAFSTYIVEEGTGIVFDESEADMVVRLLSFKKQLDDIWNESFRRNEGLGHALRESFESFMNKGRKSDSTGGTDNPKTGEMIAKYVDRLLRGGWRLAPTREAENMPLADEDAEINRQLDQVLDLFRFVHGKAVFEAFYKNDLARRLLMGRSASDDAEKSMLARLKTECGSSFTHNLESMFKDMEVARDEMSAYNSIKRERQTPLPVDLHVSVLSASAWPTYPDVQVRIPPEIATAISDFEKFYDTKYNGRKLAWKHQLAHCQLRARFPNGNKELVVSSFQAIVLLLFNELPEGGTLNYRQIQEATTLSDQELTRTLQSLACAKYRVLSKKPKGRDVSSTDEFSYNASFTDPKFRIKINQIQLKETKEENKTTHERVAADRHYETQAAIVRIMKSRKTITHAELVAEVIKATRSRGVLEPADIKKNIEKLIEKDYMEREDGNRYQYVA